MTSQCVQNGGKLKLQSHFPGVNLGQNLASDLIHAVQDFTPFFCSLREYIYKEIEAFLLSC